MNDDPLRVRLGPLIGEMVKLRDVGIGQGRRAAVQVFGSLLRSLTDNISGSTVGVGIDVPKGVHDAVGAAGSVGVHGQVAWERVGEAVAKVETTDDEGRWREVGYSLRSAAERALFLDAGSQNLWLML